MAINQIQYAHFHPERKVYVGVFITRDGYCPYTILDNPKAKNLAGLYAIRQDLIESREAIQYLIDHPLSEHIIRKNLLFSAIMQYAKSYTASKNRWAQLDSKQVFKGREPLFEEFHNQIMTLRDQYLAHAGESHYETRLMVAYLNPDLTNKKIEEVLYNSLRLMNDDSNLNLYSVMIDIVINQVESRIVTGRKNQALELESFGVEYLYNQAIVPNENTLHFVPNV